MFDVPVSCKNLLRDLISCSAQDQVVRGVSSQGTDSSGNQAGANYLPQSGRPDEEKTFIILTQRVSPLPGLVEAEMEAGVPPLGQELSVNRARVHQDTVSVTPGPSRRIQALALPSLPCWVQWLWGRGAC